MAELLKRQIKSLALLRKGTRWESAQKHALLLANDLMRRFNQEGRSQPDNQNDRRQKRLTGFHQQIRDAENSTQLLFGVAKMCECLIVWAGWRDSAAANSKKRLLQFFNSHSQLAARKQFWQAKQSQIFSQAANLLQIVLHRYQ